MATQILDNQVLVEVVHHGGMAVTGKDDGNHPAVTGHEVVGVVQKIGASVKAVAVGDHIGIGTFSGSCMNCRACKENDFYSCSRRVASTIVDEKYLVAQEEFVAKIPAGVEMKDVGPLLSGGVLLYSAMMDNNLMRPGLTIGVVGTGPMGQLAMRLLKGLNEGNEVYMVEYSAKGDVMVPPTVPLLVLDKEETVKEAERRFDYLVDTTTEDPKWEAVHNVVKPRGSIILALPSPGRISPIPFPVIGGCQIVQTTGYGSTQRMDEMIEFCISHKILPQAAAAAA